MVECLGKFAGAGVAECGIGGERLGDCFIDMGLHVGAQM